MKVRTPASLVKQYRRVGVLVDTNLLLVYLVGLIDDNLLPKFSRTKQFAPEDFGTLLAFLAQFKQVFATPNVFTEVQGLALTLDRPARNEVRAELERIVRRFEEMYVPSRAAVSSDLYATHGLTDASIWLAARNQLLVLTDDYPLTNYLSNHDVHVLNFNHIRTSQWL